MYSGDLGFFHDPKFSQKWQNIYFFHYSVKVNGSLLQYDEGLDIVRYHTCHQVTKATIKCVFYLKYQMFKNSTRNQQICYNRNNLSK